MRSFPLRPLLCGLSALVLLTGCGNLMNLAAKSRAKRQQQAMAKLTATSSEEAQSRLGQNAVGQVSYVDPIEQFVLIRTLNGIRIPPQTALETRTGGKRTALLRTTPEHNSTFTAADVLEGNPQSGDSVFPSTAKPDILPPKPPAAPAPGDLPPLPGTTPALPAGDPAAAATPGTGDFTPPPMLPVNGFDPANLPPMQQAIKTPEDLKR